jgi:hypothetical protein
LGTGFGNESYFWQANEHSDDFEEKAADRAGQLAAITKKEIDAPVTPLSTREVISQTSQPELRSMSLSFQIWALQSCTRIWDLNNIWFEKVRYEF